MSRFDNIFEYDNNLSGAGLKVGIVMSRFNLPVCEGLLSACVAELKRLGVADDDMAIANVPGALEIPLVLQSMAQSGRYNALVALGCTLIFLIALFAGSLLAVLAVILAMFLTRDAPGARLEMGWMAVMLLAPVAVFVLDAVFCAILLVKNLRIREEN